MVAIRVRLRLLRRLGSAKVRMRPSRLGGSRLPVDIWGRALVAMGQRVSLALQPACAALKGLSPPLVARRSGRLGRVEGEMGHEPRRHHRLRSVREPKDPSPLVCSLLPMHIWGRALEAKDPVRLQHG